MVSEVTGAEALFSSTTFWVATSFALFVMMVFRQAKGALVSKLDARISEIKKEIDTAESMRIQAQELLAQYQRKQRDAVKDAEEIVENSKTHCREIQRMAERELEAALIRKEEQMKERLSRMQRQAIEEMRTQAIEMAMLAAQQILTDELAKKKGSNLIDETIDGMGEQLKQAA